MHSEEKIRKKRVILTLVITAALFLTPVFGVQAKEKAISSYGNIEGMETMVKLYERDMNYLNQEIKALFEEVY